MLVRKPYLLLLYKVYGFSFWVARVDVTGDGNVQHVARWAPHRA